MAIFINLLRLNSAFPFPIPKETNMLFNCRILLKLFIASFLLPLLFSSCITAKKTMYFSDIQPAEIKIDSVSREAARMIYPGDRIVVQVITTDEESNNIFNTNAKGTSALSEGILVPPDGSIDIPTLGKFYVRGKTPNMLKTEIKSKVDVLYKDAAVYCMLSGRVVVLSSLGQNGGGGVSSGGAVASIPLVDERLTIPEVLSGIRTNNLKLNKTWIIREENGLRKIVKLNLNDAEIFRSQYYYLRNNDVIYIQPNKFNQFLEANQPFRNLIGITAGFSSLVLAVLLAIK